MSTVPAWLTDPSAIQNNTNGSQFVESTSGVFDQSMGDYVQTSNNLDYPQIPQNQPFQPQARIQNGAPRNPSLGFHNPYTVQSLVPSKRPRPREDSLGASPRQTPGNIPSSRSQTPQQSPYPVFQAGQHATAQFTQPNAFQHLQQTGSANATPSPIVQNQPFRPPGPPQRVQTTSPGPFGSNPPTFASQLSPTQSEASRVNTPHGNPSTNFPSSVPFGPGYGQRFSTPPGMNPGSWPKPSDNSNQQFPQTQNLQQAQKIYQVRLHQQQQHQNMLQNRMGNSTPGSLPMQPGPSSLPPHGGSQRPSQPMNGPGTPQQKEILYKSITHVMRQQNLPLSPTVTIGDRTLSMVDVFTAVMKYQGSRKVTTSGSWPMVAMALQLPQTQYPAAPQELKDYYEHNLAPWEDVYLQKQMQNMRNIQMQQLQGNTTAAPQQQTPPTKQINQQGQGQTPSGSGLAIPISRPTQQQTPVKQSDTTQSAGRQQPTNGFAGPPQGGARSKTANQQVGNRPGAAATPPSQRAGLPINSPSYGKKGPGIANLKSPDASATLETSALPSYSPQVQPKFIPRTKYLETHAGLDVGILGHVGQELASYKPDLPTVAELGQVDVRALNRSIQSGIRSEVRLGLDTLAQLSVYRDLQITLRFCEDLAETLVDCATDQIELLAEHAPVVSEAMDIASYEELSQICHSSNVSVREVPAFGCHEYELERAVAQVLCITTILRNLSFAESNHQTLAEDLVIDFFCNVIRLLGTRHLLLRNAANTLDFIKDVVTYLSNLAHEIVLPEREQALRLLHFLLAFAPLPLPNAKAADGVVFTAYNPMLHQYLPSAVISLAKLLARDEPNRTVYKSIFQADAASSPPYDLLTRTLALAVSPIPLQASPNSPWVRTVEARKPCLLQGLLAAEILVDLAPGPEANVARSWLSSESGLGASVSNLATYLAAGQLPAPPRPPPGRRQADAADQVPVESIALRASAVLRRLAEKVPVPEDPSSRLPSGVLPKKSLLLSMYLDPRTEVDVLGQVHSYASLEL
ncbi:MAG: hypothetical protein M1825_000040 [Sarcosagium campestre]|nr:MAG: hypothetical protein M1825_000040 [Sarcosagium campestre]